ncbi:hypothetical protein MD484_g7434, partial [Candolleomyces efflorescens]
MSSTPEKAAKNRPNPLIRYPLKLMGLYESSEDVLTPEQLVPRPIQPPNIFAGRAPCAVADGAAASTSSRRVHRPSTVFSRPLSGFPPLPEAADAAGPSRAQRHRQTHTTAPYKYGKHRSELGGQKPTKLRRSGSLASTFFNLGPGLIPQPKGQEPRTDFIEAKKRMVEIMKEHRDKLTEDDWVNYRKLSDLARQQDVKQKLQELRERQRPPINFELRRKKKRAEHARQKALEEEEQRERLRREREARLRTWEEKRRIEEREEAALLKKMKEKEEEEREHQRRKEELEELLRRNEEKEAAILRKEREEMMEQQRVKEELEGIYRTALEKQACLEKAEAELRLKKQDLRAQEKKLEAERRRTLQEERIQEKFLRQRSRALREQERMADFARIKSMLDERARQLIEARLRDLESSKPLSKEPSFCPMEVDEEMHLAPTSQQQDHRPLSPPPSHASQYSGHPFTSININQFSPPPLTQAQPNAGVSIQIFNNFQHPAN